MTSPPVAMMAPQPPARLVVDEPIAALLANGVVILPYHAENLHLLPVFGAAGLNVWPRVGHVHVTVDDGPCTGPTPAASRSSFRVCLRGHTRCWWSWPILHTMCSTARPSAS